MAYKVFNVNSKEPTLLRQYSNNKLIIASIHVIEGETKGGGSALYSPIKVSTKLPTGETHLFYIHPISFYSNTKEPNATDLPMRLEIHYCNFTEMIVESKQRIVFQLSYQVPKEDPLTILVSKDLDGYTFALTPSSQELILSKFKDAIPIRSVFVGFDTKRGFEIMYGKIENHILPTLTDLSSKQLEDMGEIKLVDARTNKVIKTA